MEQQENVEKARKWLILVIAMWYNVVRHYTSADSRPTRGRTISKANRVHPAEHSMSEGHGILSANAAVNHALRSSRHHINIINTVT